MRSFRLAVAFAVLLGLSGCGAEEEAPPVMPNVVGERLDVAISNIERVGVEDEVEVLGGGLFGIVDEANWEVCEQLPEAGQVVTEPVRLTVERDCDSSGGDVEPSPADSETARDPEPAESEADADEAEEFEPKPESEAAPGVDAQAIESAFEAHLLNNGVENITDMCDSAVTHWSCFYNGVEGVSNYLRVDLLTDGGWSDDDLSDMADAAGRHWFNFIACDFPDLKTIVVNINGIDHNVFRSDTMADTLCN